MWSGQPVNHVQNDSPASAAALMVSSTADSVFVALGLGVGSGVTAVGAAVRSVEIAGVTRPTVARGTPATKRRWA